jgi:hypothetical protein
MTTHLEKLSSISCFCGKPHRLSDGVPVAHGCFVLPVEAFWAELLGDSGLAKRLAARAAASAPLKRHKGIWKARRR